MQAFAYAQAIQGGRLSFSFAEHYNGIVVTDSIGDWTPSLEWGAELVRFEDFDSFDFACVNATEQVHAFLSTLPVLRPVTAGGRWRLYKCVHRLGLRGSVFMSFQ